MAQSLKFSCGGFKASVSRNAEFNEWIVRFYSADGSRMQNADYHTDDKADAIMTAQNELWRMHMKACDNTEYRTGFVPTARGQKVEFLCAV